MDSGVKYQYDRYNDKYRFVPLNADVAGLCARTDYTNDPWYSPGGYNRGQIKNVVRLGHNPDKTNRDTLYKAGVNPVVSFPGQGIVLFGDKTLQTKPSAFDRINVRRLFIVLEKAIATAAKFQLFEFNDSFTRAQFVNLVEPFLRDVQGRRGITDFRVKCDDTNNTGQVIDSNQFVADIFIKPARSINFITLNFVAARTSANFTEIGG
jgi:phage tail sheath protein FI